MPRTQVRVSYRRDQFSRIKPGNRTRIDSAMKSGQIEVHWSTQITQIERDLVWLGGADGAAEAKPLLNDQVLIFAGGELPTRFLQECGVQIETKFGVA